MIPLRRRALLTIALTAAMLPVACHCPHADDAPTPAAARTLTRTELFFGLSRPDGGAVTDQQWEEFLATTVTPLFPDGLTVIDAHGQWREESGRIAREPSRILIILHEPTAETNDKFEQVRVAYKQQFAQEAVMRTDVRARVSF